MSAEKNKNGPAPQPPKTLQKQQPSIEDWNLINLKRHDFEDNCLGALLSRNMQYVCSKLLKSEI